MVPWAHQSQHPNGITIGSAIFAGLTVVTDRQTNQPTDHTMPSVAITSAAMRPNNTHT